MTLWLQTAILKLRLVHFAGQPPGPLNPTTILVASFFLWFLFVLLCVLFSSHPCQGSTRRGIASKLQTQGVSFFPLWSSGRTEGCLRSASPPQQCQSCQVSEWGQRGHCRGLKWTLRSTVLTRTWLCLTFCLCPEATGTGGSDSRLPRARLLALACRYVS